MAGRQSEAYPDYAWVVTGWQDGRVVGYAMADGCVIEQSCYLREIAVLASSRRRGFGRVLAVDMAKWVGRSGMTTIFVDLSSDQAFARRARWFEGLGFATAGASNLQAVRTQDLIGRVGPHGRPQPGRSPGRGREGR